MISIANLSVRDDYTIEEREKIKPWVRKAEEKNKEENTQSWKVRGNPKKRSTLGKNHQAQMIRNTTDNEGGNAFDPLVGKEQRQQEKKLISTILRWEQRSAEDVDK